MKLSVIIPVYNEAEYLPRCLDSLYANNDVEIIFIDDGSTDGSVDIIESYKDKLKFTLLKAQHGGVSEARNIGIENAKGDYITFLDSDDALGHDSLNKMLTAIKTLKKEIIQFNHYRYYNGVCKILSKYTCKSRFYSLNELPPKWAVVWNKVYKRAFIQEHHIRFNAGQQFDEDRNFNLQCLKYTKGFQCHSEFITRKHFDNMESLCHTMDKSKVLGAVTANIELLKEEQSPEMVKVIRDCIVMHLNSRKFKDVFKVK